MLRSLIKSQCWTQPRLWIYIFIQTTTNIYNYKVHLGVHLEIYRLYQGFMIVWEHISFYLLQDCWQLVVLSWYKCMVSLHFLGGIPQHVPGEKLRYYDPNMRLSLAAAQHSVIQHLWKSEIMGREWIQKRLNLPLLKQVEENLSLPLHMDLILGITISPPLARIH